MSVVAVVYMHVHTCTCIYMYVHVQSTVSQDVQMYHSFLDKALSVERMAVLLALCIYVLLLHSREPPGGEALR